MFDFLRCCRGDNTIDVDAGDVNSIWRKRASGDDVFGLMLFVSN